MFLFSKLIIYHFFLEPRIHDEAHRLGGTPHVLPLLHAQENPPGLCGA